MTGASNEKSAIEVPVRETTSVSEWPDEYAAAQTSFVVDVQLVLEHAVRPTRAVGVVSVDWAKFVAEIVSDTPVESARFVGLKNVSTGASKLKTLIPVPTRLDSVTITPRCVLIDE